MYFRVFDCWRFLAALLVMTYHYLFWGPEGSQDAVAFLYRLSPLLDMFFMISGFFITSRYATRLHTLTDFGSFFRRRFARLYPLHLVTTLFFVMGALYAWSIEAPNYPYANDFANLPYHLLGIHALGFTDSLSLNYVSWSVSAEFFSYAMFPIVVLALRYTGSWGLAAVVLTYLSGLEIASRMGVFPSGHWTTADNLGAYRAFADFLVGGFLARMVATGTMTVRTPWLGVALMAVAISAMIAQAPWYLSYSLLVLSLWTSALAETRNPDATKPLAFAMPITAASFGVYIWHPVAEFIFLRAIWDRWLAATGWIDFHVFMVLPMLVSILIAVASFRYLEPRMAKFITGPRPAGSPRTGAAQTS